MPERNQIRYDEAVPWTLAAIDIASFGHPSRSDSVRIHLRRTLFQLVSNAFTTSEVPWDRCVSEDRGDGVFILVPPDVPTARLLDPLVSVLSALVQRHNAISSPPAQFRLRMAVHYGLVSQDEHGVTGTAVIHTFRLLDAPPFKQAFDSSAGEIGLIISDRVYHDVVRPGLGMLDPAGFLPVTVHMKETSARGWTYTSDWPAVSSTPSSPAQTSHTTRAVTDTTPSESSNVRQTVPSQPGTPNSVPLYARDVGAGTPLVLLHAYPLSSAMWLAQREDLAKRFRVITPDLRGFGGSLLGADEPSIDAMAEDVAALLRNKGIERAIICGLAMGGYVAMALGRLHPDRVLGLVLANTKASADPPDVRERRLATADRIDAEGSVEVLAEQLLPQMVGPTTFRQRVLVYGRVRGLVQSCLPKAAAWAQRAMAARIGELETLSSIQVPALIIAGSEDELATEDDARVMVEALPGAELLVLPRCGHLTALEQPDLFNQAVTEFLTTLARTNPPIVS